jgi:predicted GIY-YIG superfamily endonuclease
MAQRVPRRTWTVYILRCADGTLYTGIAIRVEARLTAHRAGKGARYTRSRRPLRLVYRERVRDRSAALRRELVIKAMTRAEKLGLIGRRRQR